ncbi:GNAT family N-acetyltransferase [Saccharospirillum mangrovi]|uniref:GNAT family N-acetyltransferase n=1 Tax=Saccharospirillum mangrovi TaxID=2161747 RepID=UPI000D34148B|nr:GNAT family N-acetyltransferase [Saccharospirillum mangrovi]
MLQIALLADKPQYAKQVATWYFDHWVSKTDPQGFDRVLSDVSSKTSRLGPPMTLLALEGDVLVGAAELKFHEMSVYPNYEHWLGGVYVAPAYRNQGVANALVTAALNNARDAGIQKLYLQTQQLDGGLYARMGFKPLEQIVYHDQQTLVMVFETIGWR